jgi:hypothetical protein
VREPALGFFQIRTTDAGWRTTIAPLSGSTENRVCGKSVLSAVLSKELIRDQHICFGQECSVAYFFCDDKDIHLKTSTALLTNVLAQLLRQNPKALIHFSNEPVYNIDKEKTAWTFGMLWRVFSRIVNDATLKPMFVAIDAIGMLSRHCASCYVCPDKHLANSI